MHAGFDKLGWFLRLSTLIAHVDNARNYIINPEVLKHGKTYIPSHPSRSNGMVIGQNLGRKAQNLHQSLLEWMHGNQESSLASYLEATSVFMKQHSKVLMLRKMNGSQEPTTERRVDQNWRSDLSGLWRWTSVSYSAAGQKSSNSTQERWVSWARNPPSHQQRVIWEKAMSQHPLITDAN